MLLTITNSNDVTADYLLGKLAAVGVPCVRFDTDLALAGASLRYDSSGPALCLGGVWRAPGDFTNVWYRRPERLVLPGGGDCPEAKLITDEWTEAVEGFFAHVPPPRWMNHPAAEAAASQKLEQLTRARSIGFTVPDTLVTQEPEELREFHRRHRGRLIIKPLGQGHVDRGDPCSDTVIMTNRVRAEDLDEGCDDLRGCPTFFQQEIRKRSDVRITVVDGAIHAVELTADDDDGVQKCDIRRDGMRDVRHERIALPNDVASRVLSLMASYGLRFSAIDMAVTEGGDWIFFEVNPNGQWAWMDLNGATDIASSFAAAFFTGPGTAAT